jgi:hypothetical protein
MGLIGIDNLLLLLSRPELALVLLTSVGLLLWRSTQLLTTGSKDLDKAPRIGIPNVIFGSLWAKFGYIKHGFYMIHEFYEAVRAFEYQKRLSGRQSNLSLLDSTQMRFFWRQIRRCMFFRLNISTSSRVSRLR